MIPESTIKIKRDTVFTKNEEAPRKKYVHTKHIYLKQKQILLQLVIHVGLINQRQNIQREHSKLKSRRKINNAKQRKTIKSSKYSIEN